MNGPEMEAVVDRAPDWQARLFHMQSTLDLDLYLGLLDLWLEAEKDWRAHGRPNRCLAEACTSRPREDVLFTASRLVSEPEPNATSKDRS